jgi:aminoglycoside phosphotransferase (APT) family kinase protein
MSSTAVRLNLAGDVLLPQRDLLLNARDVTRRLSSLLGARRPIAIDTCERVRVKYRFGESLRVLYRIIAAGRPYIVAARAFPAGRSGRAYERAVGIAPTCTGPLRAVALDAELDTVFWTFPNDRRIDGLRTLTDIPAELTEIVPGWTRSHVVAYAPEKCATAQCLDAASKVLAYAKVYAGGEGRRVFSLYEALKRNLPPRATGLSLPRALSYAETHRVLLLEAIEGERIAELDGAALLKGYSRFGAALATLHGLALPDGLHAFKRLDVEHICHAALVIGQARPDVRRVAIDLAAALTLSHNSLDEPRVCLHGDVHAKNGLLSGDRFTLIDLDQAATGHPAADLGSLLASLTYSRFTGQLDPSQEREMAHAFLNGYAAVRSLPAPDSLRWHIAAALLAERAVRAVNRVRIEGLNCLGELLDEAQKILRKGDWR